MARDERVICASADLAEGGKGVRFELPTRSAAFAIRHSGRVCAFVNRCPHAGTELDWQEGEFRDETGYYLICSTHGALFEPGSGFCVAGPCRGASLERVAVREQDGQVMLGAHPQDEREPTR